MSDDKTLPCITLISCGHCPYGDRCKFLHDPRLFSFGSQKTMRSRKRQECKQNDIFFWPKDLHLEGGDMRRYNVDPSYQYEHKIWNGFVDYLCEDKKKLRQEKSKLDDIKYVKKAKGRKSPNGVNMIY